jgi:RNA polymerase sigma factor (sigma-70 family)
MKSQLQELALGRSPAPSWSDEELVAECLAGNQKAWNALVAKYKNLVYSVPMKYRMSPEDAADIFQAVWLELYNELPRLRQPNAVRGWLATVAANQCYRWKMKRRKQGEVTESEIDLESLPGGAETPAWQEEMEREQTLREAVLRLPARCQTMVHLLFYADPPLPYSEVARKLGLAEGSIGFIRGRCLQKLKRSLEELGF